MSLDETLLTGGFADPVFHGQASFRALMEAMAEPGRPATIMATIMAEIAPPAPLGVAQAAIALTLCDTDAPVWLTQRMIAAGIDRWIGFHTGAGLTAKEDCHFAFHEAGADFPDLETYPAGSQDYPDRSATLIVELPALEGGAPLILQGPGIKDSRIITPLGLPQDFPAQWQFNRGLFPRGIDLILTAGRDFLCLPRSLTIRVQEV
ncbi:phosphonate C-P lyase system protein PhnH [Allorhizobium sp. BGMRC 0089]|uniref:phosphonate C-P lyase system protein PhnH n=1 Tax=Allorhizobium sonneratiae TaxID=2934936 RepID=UPI0020347DD5|nr:phosphonate C-P lyase system protein PhnH [Allorhizobium sonneratiae]MCM2291630.1 phosphonate C-P lyase system protein PhnH [Allorhizobium sonneratiae]